MTISNISALANLWTSTVTLVLVCGLVSLSIWIAALALDAKNRKNKFRVLCVSMAVTILGGVAGFAGGLSRVGVVGEIIPAALTFLGGLVVYLFGLKSTDNSSVNNGNVAVLVIGFSMGLFLNYAGAAGYRDDSERKQRIVDICVKLFADPQLYSSKLMADNAGAVFWKMCDPAFKDLYSPH